ncbi:phosphotransferase enzyme family protein [Streptomyces sp. NPDC056224]|uniref:phosphotransferase enzyme family protein n=1 Tax=Streptomyces sp. NPDC056224 TaxID=3345750 RepID=UPI0035E02D6A
MNAESDVAAVTDILPRCYRIVPTAVVGGPRGTATRNYLAQEHDGRRWFVKVYPPGTDLQGEQEALRLGEFARGSGVPVPAVRRSPAGELVVTAEGTAVSVSEYVDGAHTAEGGLHGCRWAAVGEAVGRLHRALAQHPTGSPRPVPASEVCDVQRSRQRLQRLLAQYGRGTTARGEFAAWARRAAEERIAALPRVAAMLSGLPPVLTAQIVHGDLASPNVLLREQEVAGLIDFRPPRHRSAAWELGRIVLDPRTVLAGPDWPAGLGEAVAAYREANPGLPVEDLLAVPRVAAGYMACSVYPLSEPVDHPAAVTPELERYGLARHAAVGVLTERLDEAEEVLRDRLS